MLSEQNRNDYVCCLETVTRGGERILFVHALAQSAGRFGKTDRLSYLGCDKPYVTRRNGGSCITTVISSVAEQMYTFRGFYDPITRITSFQLLDTGPCVLW
jgi:hypothetical protein